MTQLYTTTVNVTGGREGHAKSLDGNLDVDLAAIKGNTNKEERNKLFVNRLKNDIHLGETVNVMNDMIQQYFIAQNKQAARADSK